MTPVRGIITILCIVFTTLGYAQSAELNDATQEQNVRALESRITALKNDPEKLARSIEEGKNRTVLCRTCHGKDGIAVKEGVPNLAGQNPIYIVDQFQRFGDGRRYDFLMSGLARNFSDEDKIKVALYYSNLESRASGGGDPALLAQGEEIYKSNCSQCHGLDGHGQKGYARLAGQRSDYVLKMLGEFRDRTGRRTNPWMTAVAVQLNEQQMQAVATYIARLQ